MSRRAASVHRDDVKLVRLAEHKLLSRCSPAEIRRIAAATDPVQIEAGQTLAEQGWMAGWLFLVHRGVGEVVRDGHPEGVVWSGQTFGAVEVLGAGKYTATLRASTSMDVFLLDRRYLAGLLETAPGLRRALREAIEQDEGPGARRVLAAWDGDADRRRARRLRTRRLMAGLLVVLAIATACAARYHPPVGLEVPGPTIDVSHDITIEGVPTTPLTGRYLVVTVRETRPSLLGLAINAAHARRRVVPALASTTSSAERRGRAMFRASRVDAAAAAAVALGMDVHLSGTGAGVKDFISLTSSDVLRVGDVIVAADGRPVSVAAQLLGPAKPRTLRVERDGERIDVDVSGRQWADVDLETRDVTFRLPFEVHFRNHRIAGPSAGLVYALALYDLLSEQDIAQGRTIAATGTIDAEGRVGDVGGVTEKVMGAQSAGAEILLVPFTQISGSHGAIGVRSLDAALAALRRSSTVAG